MKEALFYKKESGGKVTCLLCGHYCNIACANCGICGVRQNQEGSLYSLNYGELAAESVDPIEKKPLFHFLPGSKSYSIASLGCNFKCEFCQNWQISQIKEAQNLGIKTNKVKANEIIDSALASRCPSISYTYTEPTVYFEFAYDCAVLAKQKGLKNIFVTNGYMSKEALKYIRPYLDAANVDLKSFREDFYSKVCKASLKPVVDNIILMKELGIWVEVTTLIIPGYNDSDEELEQIASFIFSLDENIPWHISSFYPQYKFSDAKPASLLSLEKAYNIGKDKGLKFVYLGNVFTDYGNNTYCPVCSQLIIERKGFCVEKSDIIDGQCGICGVKIAGRF